MRATAAPRSVLSVPTGDDRKLTRRAKGLTVIDGPYLCVDDGEPCRAAVDEAAAPGFDGEWVIHPRQLSYVDERFTPTAEAIAVAARRTPDRADLGAR